MLKFAFQLGVKKAYEESGMTHPQMLAAQNLAGLGGGIVGGTGGGLLGKYLGGRAAETFGQQRLLGGVDPKTVDKAKLIGALLGTVGGTGLGMYAGKQIPKWLGNEVKPQHQAQSQGQELPPQPLANQDDAERASWLIPEIYGLTPDMNMWGNPGAGGNAPDMENYFPEY